MSELLDRIVAEIERGEPVFSTDASVALRVRLALDDPEIHIERAAKLVQAEPLLAARVVALANSVAFNRSGRKVADVFNALMVLGLKFVRALATALVVRQMAVSADAPGSRAAARRLWEHTAHVAALAFLLARQFKAATPDVAMFAGIVHEVGGFYMLSRASPDSELFVGEGASPWACGGEMRVGRAILRMLAAPESVQAAIETLWEGQVSLPPANLGDVLVLADRLTPILSPLPQPDGDPGLAERIGAEPELARVLDESGEELEALTSALRF